MLKIFAFIFTAWGIFSIYYIYLAYKNKKINKYLYESIPNVFTTIGILGTFLGIYIGLQDFDVDNINESIPSLLQGLKGAFLTSIVGIILSIVFGRISDLVAGLHEDNEDKDSNDLLSELNKNLIKVNDSIHLLKKDNSDNASFIDDSLNTLKNKVSADVEQLQMVLDDRLEQNHIELLENSEKNIKQIENKIEEASNKQNDIVKDQGSKFNDYGNLIKEYLSNLNESSSTTQKLIDETKNSLIEKQQQVSDKNLNKLEETKNSITQKQEDVSSKQLDKFDELSKILAENNVKALVEVMEKVTEEFNNQMSDLINRLVKENFEELNNSVKQLNSWQEENKLMVEDLTNKYKETTAEFVSAAEAIKNISEVTNIIYQNTSKITDENSKLKELLNKFEEIMIKDTRFEKSSKNMLDGIDKIKSNIDAFDQTTNKLNQWIDKEHGLKQGTEQLLVKLDDISKIKAYDGEFWDQTKKQLNEGLNIVTNTSKRLSSDLDSIDEVYQNQLKQLLGNLDQLIQRIIKNYDLKND